MKKTIIITLSILFTVSVFGQSWKQNLPVKTGDYTYFEIQKAFNDYWEPYDVKAGYYFENGKKEKASGWKQFKRWEWYWKDRVNPTTGKFPKTTGWKEMEKYKSKNGGDQKAYEGNWTNLGPNSSDGGYAGIGRLNCIAFHPNDNDIFYVGAPAGGLWKTEDGGNTWTVLTDNNAVLGVSSIVIVPTANEDILYIATGDRDGGSSISLHGGHYGDNHSIGVLKSIDGGQTWATTDLTFDVGERGFVNKILLHPGFTEVLYAATSDGFFRTLDGGTNWVKIYLGAFVDFEFKPNDPLIIYGASRGGYVYKSTDGGFNFPTSSFVGSARVEIAVSPDEPTWVYAASSKPDGSLRGIYRSINSSDSFTMIYNGSSANQNLLGNHCTGSGSEGQGNYDLALAVKPNDAETLFLGGVNTWKSTDGGFSWDINSMWTSHNTFNSCGAPVVHADKHYLAYQNNSTLFECNDGGVYKTINGGTSWTDLSDGLVISQIYKIGLSQTNKNDIMAGFQDNGSKNYFNGNWSDVVGGDGMECIIDYTDDDTQYGESQRGNIVRTTNHWANSTNITVNNFGNPINGLDETGDWITPYIIHPTNHNTLYLGLQSIWTSIDQGDNWVKLLDNNSDPLHYLAISHSDPETFYFGYSGNLYRTEDEFASFENVNGILPLDSSRLTSICIDKSNHHKIWVSLGQYNDDKVYKSIDGGDNWTNISAGLPSLPVLSIIKNEQNTAEDELYTATDVGVFVKTGNTDWELFSEGLPNVFTTELEIYYDGANPANSRLRAATFGRGLWESELKYTAIQDAVWTGAVSTNWMTPENWAGDILPTRYKNAIIPGGTPNDPLIGLFQFASCKTLTIEAGATVTQNAYGGLPSYLSIYGNLISTHGTLSQNTNSCYLTFKGDEDSYWIDNNEDDTYKNVTIDMENPSNVLFIQEDKIISNGFTVNCGVSRMGLFKSMDFNGSNFEVNANATLELYAGQTIECYGSMVFSDSSNAIITGGSIYCGGDFVVEPNTDYDITFGGSSSLTMNGLFGQTIESPDGSLHLNDFIISKPNTCYLGSDLDINGDLSIINGSLSSGNSSSPTAVYDIYIEGNWGNIIGAGGFIPNSGTVIFDGNAGNQFCTAEAFNEIEVDKPTDLLIINDVMVYCGSYNWTSGGIAVINGTFSASDLVDDAIYGDFSLNGGEINIANYGSYIDLNGNIAISSGTFNIFGGDDWSYWPYSQDASISMTGGTLDFHDQGIQIDNSVHDLYSSISGGTIRTTEGISGERADFQPTGGTIEIYGNNGAMVNQSNGCYFKDFVINTSTVKASPKQVVSKHRDKKHDKEKGAKSVVVELNSDLYVNGSFYITDGVFNANNHTINVYGNWINNVGTDGFQESTGTVVFDGQYTPQTCTSEDFNNLEVANLSDLNLAISDADVTCNNYNWTSGGISVHNGSFTATDLVDNGIYGNYNLSGTGEINVSNYGGYIDLNGSISISGGVFNVYGGTIESYWPYTEDASIEMSGGVLDFHDQGIYVYNTTLQSLNNDISGGTIKTASGFSGNRADFAPTGGTFEFYGNSDAFISQYNGSTLHNIVINKNYVKGSSLNPNPVITENTTIEKREGKTLKGPSDANMLSMQSALLFTGDLTISDGILNTSGNDIELYGNWTNNMDNTAFLENTSTVIFGGNIGADILTAETFYNLTMDKSYSGYAGLEIMGVEINVQNNLEIQDGTIEMNNNSVLNIGNDLLIANNAGLNAYSDINLSINLGGNFIDNNATPNSFNGFFPGTSTFTFNGNADQHLTSVATEQTFYDLVIDKGSGQFKSHNDIYCIKDLNILDGEWLDNTNGLTHSIEEDFIVWPDGSFLQGPALNTVNIISAKDSEIGFNGSGFIYNLSIDKSTITKSANGGNPEPGEEPLVYQDNGKGTKSSAVNIISNIFCGGFGETSIEYASVDLNGYNFTSTGNFNINSFGILNMDASSVLSIGSGKALNVNSDGYLMAAGTPGTPAIFTSYTGGTNYFDFNVNNGGSISAEHVIFEQMSDYGVNINPGALVDDAHAFNNCIFRNSEPGSVSSLLSLANNQVLTCTDAVFPDNTWGSGYNVWKNLGTNGEITFVGATGGFSGEDYDYDPYNLIHWGDHGTTLAVTAYLEGPFNGYEMETLLNDDGHLPLSQPYNGTYWNYNGTESVAAIPNQHVVDWVLVELRDADFAANATPATIIERQAAFVLVDGSIVGLDGSSNLQFTSSPSQNLFVVVYHRNHLNVMSAIPVTENGGVYDYDFTTGVNQAYQNGQAGQKEIATGIWGLYGGDGANGGNITDFDKDNIWKPETGTTGYSQADYNLDGQVENMDKNDVWVGNYMKSSQVPE